MGEVFDGEDKECKGSKADGSVNDDDFFLGEGDDEGIHIALHLAGDGKEAGGLVPAAELEQPGACEHHAGCGRGDGHEAVGNTQRFLRCEVAKEHVGSVESKVRERCQLHDSRSLAEYPDDATYCAAWVWI